MILQTEAIVLHRMKYKNSSLIARIFTKDFGKMSIIMNGAGKQKGNVFGIIEPPNIIKLNYYQRKQGSLQTCKEVHFLHHNPLIKQDILKLGVSLSIVEIVDKHKLRIILKTKDIIVQIILLIKLPIKSKPTLPICVIHIKDTILRRHDLIVTNAP